VGGVIVFLLGALWGVEVGKRSAARKLPEIIKAAEETGREQERLSHKNKLLDNGRLFDAYPDNGPPSRTGRIRYTGERPHPGDRPSTRM
jgi:hypothetical protein